MDLSKKLNVTLNLVAVHTSILFSIQADILSYLIIHRKNLAFTSLIFFYFTSNFFFIAYEKIADITSKFRYQIYSNVKLHYFPLRLFCLRFFT